MSDSNEQLTRTAFYALAEELRANLVSKMKEIEKMDLSDEQRREAIVLLVRSQAAQDLAALDSISWAYEYPKEAQE